MSPLKRGTLEFGHLSGREELKNHVFFCLQVVDVSFEVHVCLRTKHQGQ